MTDREMSNLTIENNQADQCWEAHVDQQLAVAEYRRRGNTIFFIHTDVPHELEGQGVASKLMKTALDEARALVEETGERFWEAEIYRLKGELLLKAEDAGLYRGVTEGMQDAESPKGCFLTAIEIARRQEGSR